MYSRNNYSAAKAMSNSISAMENSNMISTATANDAVCNDKVEINKENRMDKENTKSAGVSHPAAKMDNRGKNIDKNSMEYLNKNWCINCVEEAIHFIEMSGLQGELLDTIKGCLPQYCCDTFADTLQDLGLWDSDIEFILSNRRDFVTFEFIKDHVENGGSIGDWTLLDLDEVKEWCEGKSVLVDDEEMSLIDFLNLDSITVSEFMEWQEDWGCSDDPLAWHMTSHLNLDSFLEVYGEDPDGQWESPEWDGSKRIDQQNSVA
jgi:hypothetical protein